MAALALGSTVLGCRLLSGESAVPVIDPESFAITPAAVGATLVALEKLPSLGALRAGLDSVKSTLKGGVSAFLRLKSGGLQLSFRC